MDKDRLNSNRNEEVNRKAPPKPPVLPKSYQGAKPPVMKSTVQKPENNNDVKVEYNSPSMPNHKDVATHDSNNSEPDVVITKSNHVVDKISKPSTTTTSAYGSYIDKKSIFKAIAAVLAIIFVVGGAIALLVFRSDVGVSAETTVYNQPNAGLTNLNSLRKYENLEELRLYNSGVEDIKGIRDLTKLKIVYLRQNKIDDVSALKNLKNVEYLHLESNNITDISALAGLTKLKVLIIGQNNIKDLSPLANLVNLEELDLSYNQIEDVSPLVNLTKLRRLKLNNNNISNVDALSGMTELRDLYLRDNGDIRDLSPLVGMHKMEWASFNPPSLELDIIYDLKKANPDAIYYFYYRGDYIYAHEEFVWDPGPPPEPGDRNKN